MQTAMCRSPPTKEATTSLWAGPSAHGRGIKADVRRRRPWYASDWTDGWNAKTTASLFYMFFTSIAPAITFADLLDSATKGKIGVVEVCLSSCVSGVMGTIPNAALHGLFIFMALESLPGNELWERVCLLVSEPRLRRSDRAWYSLEFPVIARFTRLQFALAVVIFFVTEVPVIGMTFPLFIAALVFVRTKYLPKKYDARTLELIDPLIDLAPIDKTPSTADLLEEGTPPSSPAPQVVSSPVRNRAGSA